VESEISLLRTGLGGTKSERHRQRRKSESNTRHHPNISGSSERRGQPLKSGFIAQAPVSFAQAIPKQPIR
jgi:hypothetical protein